MNFLEERIVKDGVVKAGNILKVDSFLNHQMDVRLFRQMGEEFKRRFADKPINKILTIEASGIGIACVAAECFDVPVVFAKKSQSVNIDGDIYVSEVESFTHKRVNRVIVSKKFLGPEDHILIIDDFLANGCALQGLISIVDQAGGRIPFQTVRRFAVMQSISPCTMRRDRSSRRRKSKPCARTRKNTARRRWRCR